LLLQQVAVKVESLSGFTNSLLRPHVFPQVVCLLYSYCISIFFTFLRVISEVVFTEIVDYIK
jgi:hypothetical protein